MFYLKNKMLSFSTFTGSVQTGVAILAESAKHIRPVTLELGGKSPLVIFNDFDVDNAVQGAMQANFYSQGQVCSNGTRVYVHEEIYDEFVQKLITQGNGFQRINTKNRILEVGVTKKGNFLKISGHHKFFFKNLKKYSSLIGRNSTSFNNSN